LVDARPKVVAAWIGMQKPFWIAGSHTLTKRSKFIRKNWGRGIVMRKNIFSFVIFNVAIGYDKRRENRNRMRN